MQLSAFNFPPDPNLAPLQYAGVLERPVVLTGLGGVLSLALGKLLERAREKTARKNTNLTNGHEKRIVMMMSTGAK